MNQNYFHFASLSGLLAGTTIATSIILNQSPVVAKTAQDIAQLATSRTVQISNTLNQGGSGVIIANKGSTYKVLTANHVVKWTDLKYTVRTYTGKEYSVTDVQRCQKGQGGADLAVITFSSVDKYPVATVSGYDQVTVGADIYVAGYPLPGSGESQRDLEFTNGIVTSRPANRSQGYTLRYNAVTRSGMSGGPVFDANGRVIGIHGLGDSAGQVQTQSGETLAIKTGFNAAIPVSVFMALLSQTGLSRADLLVDTIPVANTTLSLNNPDDARSFYARGLSRSDEGNKQGAIEDLNQAIRLNPTDAAAYRNRGVARLELIGNTDLELSSSANREALQQSIDDFSQALRLSPNDAISYSNRGISRYFSGNKQGYMEDLNQALQLDPGDTKAYTNRALIRLKTGAYQEAIDDATKALSLNPGSIDAYGLRGVARLNLKDYKGAIEEFNQQIRLDTSYFVAYHNRGSARYELLDYQGAILDYNEALRINPNFATSYGNRGWARYSIGDKQGSIEDLHKAADLYLKSGNMDQYKEALSFIERIQSGKVENRGKGDCYIATATLKGGGSEAQLNLLRGWRDEVLKPTTQGQKLLTIYDQIGPVIASRVKENSVLANSFLYLFIFPAIWLVRQRLNNSRFCHPFNFLIYSIFLMVLTYGSVLYVFYRMLGWTYYPNRTSH